MPIAETFYFRDESGRSLGDVAVLDTMVTVVDASSFLKLVHQAPELMELKMAIDETDSRNLAELLVEQVEFANVILVNKVDLIKADDLQALMVLIQQLNPSARILTTTRSKIDLHEILHTGLFSLDEAKASAGWMQVLLGKETPQTEEYGIHHFVFRDNRPFHPQRFWNLIHEGLDFSAILRSKGFFWVASAPEILGQWSHAGGAIAYGPKANWLASMPPSEWDLTPAEMKELERTWDPVFGDRRQEIVLIGQNMDSDSILNCFYDALLTEDELRLGSQHWQVGDYPFSDWKDQLVLEETTGPN
jgi:G3E family GTPase